MASHGAPTLGSGCGLRYATGTGMPKLIYYFFGFHYNKRIWCIGINAKCEGRMPYTHTHHETTVNYVKIYTRCLSLLLSFNRERCHSVCVCGRSKTSSCHSFIFILFFASLSWKFFSLPNARGVSGYTLAHPFAIDRSWSAHTNYSCTIESTSWSMFAIGFSLTTLM